MLYLILLPPLVIIGGVLIYLGRLPGTFEVRRSRLMGRDRQTLFDAVRDLRGWPAWSPWLMHEPEAKLSYSEDPDSEGGSYRWDGKHIGAGTLSQVRFQAPTRIDQRIVSRRPFKTQSDVWWELEEQAGGTKVTWCMRGRMPFGLRAMAPMMAGLIAKDFDLGLAMLQGHLDPDAEHPRIRFIGPIDQEPQNAITVPFSGDMEAMVERMSADFPRMSSHLQRLGVAPAGPAFTAYHKIDAKAAGFICDLAIPIPEGTEPGPFTVKQLGGGRYFMTEIQGSYDFMEPAWYSVMTHMRLYRLKKDGSRPSLEVYVTDPSRVTHSNEIMTRILVPIR
jgi:DNA gyrase inhibitor GyrI